MGNCSYHCVVAFVADTQSSVYQLQKPQHNDSYNYPHCTKLPIRAFFIKNIFASGELFLVIATGKTRPVLKVAWKGLSDNWGTQ